jgi:hypothetical protein
MIVFWSCGQGGRTLFWWGGSTALRADSGGTPPVVVINAYYPVRMRRLAAR